MRPPSSNSNDRRQEGCFQGCFQGRFQKGLLALCFGVILVPCLFWLARPAPKALLEVERNALFLKEGKLCFKDSSLPFSGVMLEHYPGGQIQSRSLVLDGVLDGPSRGYYTNGQMQVEEHFKAGVSDGIRTKWYPNGAKLSEATIVNGKLAGTFRRWHENGSLAEIVEMKDGQPEGPSTSFHPDGSVKARATVQNGKIIEQKFWKLGEFKDPGNAASKHGT